MEIQEVKKKHRKLTLLMGEHGQLRALVRAMENQFKNGIEYAPEYMKNVCKRIIAIENLFDEILK